MPAKGASRPPPPPIQTRGRKGRRGSKNYMWLPRQTKGEDGVDKKSKAGTEEF